MKGRDSSYSAAPGALIFQSKWVVFVSRPWEGIFSCVGRHCAVTDSNTQQFLLYNLNSSYVRFRGRVQFTLQVLHYREQHHTLQRVCDHRIARWIDVWTWNGACVSTGQSVYRVTAQWVETEDALVIQSVWWWRGDVAAYNKHPAVFGSDNYSALILITV